MKKIKLTKDTYLYILTIIICFSFFMYFYTGYINSDNYNYAVEAIHTYDNTIFDGNLNTANSKISPRFFANQITSFLMHSLNVDWYAIWMIITLITYFLYSLAVTNTVFRCFKDNRIIYSICLILMVAKSTTGELGGFSTNGAEDVFLGAGIAVAMLGISFVLGNRPKWDIAWISLALATILHIHEGIWGGLIVFIWWIGTAIIEKKIEFRLFRLLPIYIFTVLLCTIPSMLSNDIVDNALFIEIYAFIRTPHHLVPSAWGKLGIIKSFLLLAFPTMLAIQKGLHDKDKNMLRNVLLRSGSYLTVWILLLFMNYVFVEVIPNGTIATLYFSKCFKYISFLAMICYLWLIDSYFKDGKPEIAVFILLLALSGKDFGTYGALIFLLLTILIERNSERLVPSIQNIQLESTILSTLVIITFSLILRFNYIIIGIFILAVIAFEILMPSLASSKMKQKVNLHPLVFFVLIIVILSVSTYGKLYLIQNGTVKLVTPKECLIKSASIDIYDLANDFNAKTDKNIEFLADPNDDKTGWFQLISQRNCYQIWKITPSSKKTIMQWYERYTKINNFSSRTSYNIEAVMKEAGDKYILVASSYFEDYDSNQNFKVFLSTNSYRIYELK